MPGHRSLFVRAGSLTQLRKCLLTQRCAGHFSQPAPGFGCATAATGSGTRKLAFGLLFASRGLWPYAAGTTA